MNLTIDPWVPALSAQGRTELFSLADLFARAHELRDLAAKPHERIALMRLLVCITQAALEGPADEEAWQSCRSLIQPRVRAYLKKWGHSFELFGDGARFLQVPNLAPGKESDDGNPSTKLDLALATGNNSTLFDNEAGAERTTPSARAALNLLAFQCFAPGGRIGVAKWNGKDTADKGSSNHAPCTPSSMVHALLLGDSLLESIYLNLLSREIVADSLGPKRWGKPVWEFPVEKAEDRGAVENATMTYLGRLVPLSRAVRLQDPGATIILANGLNYPIFPAFREATATIIRRKEELALLPGATSRSLWRQLAAVSVRRRSSADSTCGPLALQHVSTAQNSTLWVAAFVTDKAKIEDVIESVYSLPPQMFSEFGRAAYEKGIAYAAEQEGVLVRAIKTYASSLKVAEPAYDLGRQQFWTRVEQHLHNLFDLARDTRPSPVAPGAKPSVPPPPALLNKPVRARLLGGDMIVLQEPRPRPSRMRSSRSMPDLRPVQRFRSAWPPRTNGSGSKARPKREKSRPNPGMAKPKPTATLYSATCAGIRSGFGVFPWGSPTKRRDRLAAMRPGCDRCWAQPM